MSGLKNHTDLELLELFRQDYEGAFAELFNRYWYPLYKVARQGLNAHEDAEEVVQELFTVLWQRRKTLQIINLSSYLRGAIRKRVIDKIRTRIVHEKYWLYYSRFQPDHGDDTENAVAFDELNQQLEQAISHLPTRSQEVFRLNRLEGRSISEIAALLNLSERAIEYHITKSLRVLKSHLKDFILQLTLFIYFFL